jgi:hypothetical protein
VLAKRGRARSFGPSRRASTASEGVTPRGLGSEPNESRPSARLRRRASERRDSSGVKHSEGPSEVRARERVSLEGPSAPPAATNTPPPDEDLGTKERPEGPKGAKICTITGAYRKTTLNVLVPYISFPKDRVLRRGAGLSATCSGA